MGPNIKSRTTFEIMKLLKMALKHYSGFVSETFYRNLNFFWKTKIGNTFKKTYKYTEPLSGIVDLIINKKITIN